jgi:hypothetical protein
MGELTFPNFIVLNDWRLFTKKIMVIGERAVDIDESILQEVFELHDLWGYWHDSTLVSDGDELGADKFCIQIIRVFKWDLQKAKERLKLMQRRMEWKYPGYNEYCTHVFVTLANKLLSLKKGQ